MEVIVTAKSTGTKKVGKWNLKYEWETLNNAKPEAIKVTGNDGKNGFLNCDFGTNTKQITFGGGVEWDAEVVQSIFTELDTINSQFAPVQ